MLTAVRFLHAVGIELSLAVAPSVSADLVTPLGGIGKPVVVRFVRPDRRPARTFDRAVSAGPGRIGVFEQFTLLIEPNALDEAFLDITCSPRLVGDPLATGRELEAHV